MSGQTHEVTVLVVDDSSTVRKQVRDALAGCRCKVREAADGSAGLRAAREAGDLGLVICDINMPRLDGIDMLAGLRAEGIDAPVIMLTTEGQPSLIQRARELGASGWIVKPFQPPMLRRAVDKLLGHEVAS